MEKGRVLVNDDGPMILDICQSTLTYRDYEVQVCDRGQEGIDAARQETYNVVMIDLMMYDVEGLNVLRQVRSIDAHTMAVMIKGQPSIATAVEAIKEGAYHYLPKPVSPDQLQIVAELRLAEKAAGRRKFAASKDAEFPAGV